MQEIKEIAEESNHNNNNNHTKAIGFKVDLLIELQIDQANVQSATSLLKFK